MLELGRGRLWKIKRVLTSSLREWYGITPILLQTLRRGAYNVV